MAGGVALGGRKRQLLKRMHNGKVKKKMLKSVKSGGCWRIVGGGGRASGESVKSLAVLQVSQLAQSRDDDRWGRDCGGEEE